MEGNFILKLKDKKTVAVGTMEFVFEKPAGFTYLAGQHLDWTEIDPPESDAEGSSRDFTLSSAPFEDYLALTTRMRDTAFKRVLKNMPIGGKVQASGPEGHFFLPEDVGRQVVFLAGGIGVTPFRSMALQAARDKLAQKIYLFYSNRTPENAAYLEELQNLEKQSPNFKLIATMTQDPHWKGEAGYIDQKMLLKYLRSPGELRRALFFIAGPPQMVAAMRQTLSEVKVPVENILTEQFTGY